MNILKFLLPQLLIFSLSPVSTFHYYHFIYNVSSNSEVVVVMTNKKMFHWFHCLFQTLGSWMLYEYQCSYPQSCGANGLVVPLIRFFPDMKFKFHLFRCQSVLWKLPYSLAGLWHFPGEKIAFLFSARVLVFWQISTTHNGSIWRALEVDESKPQ